MNSTPTGIHPAPTIFTQAQIEADNILQFFHYAHLPETLQATSCPFCLLAEEMVNTLPRCAERSVALRKLLEAKDAAVRANVGMPANSGLPNHALNAGLREETPTPKFVHPDDIEDATVETVEIGNHDIDTDGPIPFNG